MASSHSQQTPGPADRPKGHPSANLFVEEKKKLLDKSFTDLEDMFMARCPKCRPQAPEDWTQNKWTDNDRLPMRWEIISNRVLPSLSTLTPRQLLRQNFGATVQLRCSACNEQCGEIVVSDTPEKLYNDLRYYVCHDPSLPLLYHPHEAMPDIPSDAARCCDLAHRFPAEEYLTQEVLSRIEKSLVAGALQKVLHKKMAAARKKHGDPHKSYIRIGLLFRPLGSITAVLELWPSRHSSPKHQHGGCAGSVRLVHGNLRMRLYKTLQDEEPMKLPGSDEAGIIEMQAPATTWLNRSNWYVHTVQAPGDGISSRPRPEGIRLSTLSWFRSWDEASAESDAVNPRGFALSLHVYLSCTDEFAFTVDHPGSQSSSQASSLRTPEKGNPRNDFVWVIPGFRINDERAQNIPSFNDQVIGSKSAAITDKKLSYISAVERDPSNAKAWFNLAVYGCGGRVNGTSYDSKECCVRSLELDPADAMAWYHLYICGGGSVNGARWPALKCWRHYELAGLHSKEGLKRCYIRALELDPDNAVAWLGLGECLLGVGEIGEKKLLCGGSYVDEKTCFLRAVELDPDVSPVAWILLNFLCPGEVIVIKGTSYNIEKCCIRAELLAAGVAQ